MWFLHCPLKNEAALLKVPFQYNVHLLAVWSQFVMYWTMKGVLCVIYTEIETNSCRWNKQARCNVVNTQVCYFYSACLFIFTDCELLQIDSVSVIKRVEFSLRNSLKIKPKSKLHILPLYLLETF